MTPIAELLLKHTAVRVSLDPPFEWTSGIVSPVYCDNRLMTGFTEPRQQIVSALVQKIRSSNLKPEVIAGTATAAISWAAFVAAELDLPMVYIRPEPKKHGSKKQIEGYLAVNSKVVLIEDLISTAGSSVKSAAALRDEGQSAVLGIVSIMNWELPQAEAALRAANLEAISLTGFSEIIPLAVERGDISEEESERILQFRADPENWAKKFL